MKRLALVGGIISFTVCIVSLLLFAWNRFSYYHVMDGTTNLYDRLYQRMTFCFGTGIVFAVIGILCMCFFFKK